MLIYQFYTNKKALKEYQLFFFNKVGKGRDVFKKY